MAPIVADPQGIKSNRSSSQSRNVRIMGKIRGLAHRESESMSQHSKPWITVKKPDENGSSDKCTIFLDTQSICRNVGYELDYCYEQHEQIDQIYSREIQPLILKVLDGRNASVIALGARGSGKTYTIQGSREKPGLAVIAMSEILSKAKESGKSVSVSLYELTQEQVKDLLNPDHPVIEVLEDAQGKINIKGLLQASVKSIKEFHNMYFSQGTQKVPTDQPRTKGLIVYISSDDDKLEMESKINFVDLAGYEDPRKSSKDGITLAESSRTRNNKSLYALLNVVSAINSNEMRVPYRESKLTRILQDSLGGRSHVLLLTCLNPSFCQESLRSISLVSRSCRSTKHVLSDSTNRSQSLAKVKVLSSLEGETKMSASLSVKKQTGQSRLLSTKKASCVLKGRKLFDEAEKVNSKQLRCQSEDVSAQKSKILRSLALVVAPFSLEEAPQDKSSECSSSVEQIEDVNFEGLGSQSMSKLENTLLSSAIDDGPTITMKTDVSPHTGIYNLGASTCEENNSLHKQDNRSPLLSERLKEISDNLRAICESTPLMITAPENIVAPCSSQVCYNDVMEPKTPVMELNSARYCSPHAGTFSNRSAKVKHSLVQEYLNFLNSANKEELKSIKGIGERRATYILEKRQESPEPFKSLDDLQNIGLSAKQIKGMMKQVAGNLFE